MSSLTLANKLGVRANGRLDVVHAPRTFRIALPLGATLRRSALAPSELVLAFYSRRARLERELAELTRSLSTTGALWLAWPKKSSGVSSDLSDRVVRDYGLCVGLVDTKVCSVDDTWSALRFTRRRGTGT